MLLSVISSEAQTKTDIKQNIRLDSLEKKDAIQTVQIKALQDEITKLKSGMVVRNTLAAYSPAYLKDSVNINNRKDTIKVIYIKP